MQQYHLVTISNTNALHPQLQALIFASVLLQVVSAALPSAKHQIAWVTHRWQTCAMRLPVVRDLVDAYLILFLWQQDRDQAPGYHARFLPSSQQVRNNLCVAMDHTYAHGNEHNPV